MAGISAERQETSVIEAINKAVRANRAPISVKAGKTIINGVISAHKFSGRQMSGSEPYTDIVIKTVGGKEINCSLKGETAPSLAGGGLSGLNVLVPNLVGKFMKTAYTLLVKKLKAGDKVPDIYGEINPADRLKIVRGSSAIGGPIDFMYIGQMTVSSKFDNASSTLIFANGALISSKEFAQTHRLFFRLRARREDQRFDPLAKDNKGLPKIYGKSPSKGDSAGRIVITDKVPSAATIVKI